MQQQGHGLIRQHQRDAHTLPTHHKLQVYRKYGKQMLVLTVHECKGLEFQVWLWIGLSCR